MYVKYNWKLHFYERKQQQTASLGRKPMWRRAQSEISGRNIPNKTQNVTNLSSDKNVGAKWIATIHVCLL